MVRLAYPEIEPYESGHLQVGDGNAVYWEVCGNPAGKAALVLHGGPGAGCSSWHRRLFDPKLYRIVLLDQRGCGRSTPHASSPDVSLAANTTWHLIDDIERLRAELRVDRWLVLGGSWGSCLGLAYAETHPDHVSELILTGVCSGRQREYDWAYGGGLAALFPAEWQRFVAAVLSAECEGNLLESYARMLDDPRPAIRKQAVAAWISWDTLGVSVEPEPDLIAPFEDPEFATAFARLSVHYFRHRAWLDEGVLLQNADRLSAIRGRIVQGRYDLQTPVVTAWELHQRWPRSELIVVEREGHSPHTPSMLNELIRATDAFADG